MSKEINLFTVSEDEKMTEEIIVVAEDTPIVISPEFTQQKEPDKKEESSDWRVSKHPKHFVIFLIGEINRVLKPNTARGSKSLLEKALGQYKQLDSYISQALRSDYDDHIDVSKVDEIRKIVDSYKDQVQDALDGIDMMTKQKRNIRRRKADEENGELIKEATTPTFNGLQVQISAFERAIVGAMINGAVSGGRNIEELYKSAKEKYKFSEREELAILQILADFGYPTFKDRLMVGEKNGDPTRTENFGEWQSQYYA